MDRKVDAVACLRMTDVAAPELAMLCQTVAAAQI